MTSQAAPPESTARSDTFLRILGVDPGSKVTGWGLVGGSAARPRLLDCGVIRLGRDTETLALRLSRLQRELGALIERTRPGGSAVEAPFHGTNARSSLTLAHSRGVILAGLAAAGLEIGEYSPATVKKAVTGNGRATKDQVRAMVRQLLRSPDVRLEHDASDALAVALCHSATRRFHEAVRRAETAAAPPRT